MQRKSQQFSKKDRKKVVVDWILASGDRTAQRRMLALKWLDEGQYTDYRYNVESCNNGSRIYLLRPTFLNKGFDFQVNLEGFKSRLPKKRKSNSEKPSHGDVIADLKEKVARYPALTDDLFSAISAVYDCEEIKDILKRHPRLQKVAVGLPLDATLRIIKWLFIEQDLTYWAWSGRNRLMSAMENQVFDFEAD